MRLIKNNIVEHSVIPNPPLYCFGGFNASIEISKIKTVEQRYWYGNDDNLSIPVLVVRLIDDTFITIDFDSPDDAQEALKEFMRFKIKVVSDAD